MTLELATEFIRAEAVRQYGSEAGLSRRLGHPHASTVWRWLNGEPQPSGDDLLTLGAALDVDPVLLFELRADAFAEFCRERVRSPATAIPKKWAGLAGRLWGEREDWPDEEIANYYGHDRWFAAPFTHDPHVRRNLYATFLIRDFTARHVWHIAWRDVDAFAVALWHPYGFVRLFDGRLTLFAFSGETHETSVPAGAEEFGIQSWYGEGSAEFKLVSLHPFAATAAFSQPSAHVPTVRFSFSGAVEDPPEEEESR